MTDASRHDWTRPQVLALFKSWSVTAVDVACTHVCPKELQGRNSFSFMPELPKAEPDCVCRTANANTERGPEGECHGWHE